MGGEGDAASRPEELFEGSQHGELGAQSTENVREHERVERPGTERLHSAFSGHEGGARLEVLALGSLRRRDPWLVREVSPDDGAAGRGCEVEGRVATAGSDIEQPTNGCWGRLGFVAVDVAASFIATARTSIELRAEHADELAALEPPGSFETRQADNRAQLAATEDGLLRRSLISAVRPPR